MVLNELIVAVVFRGINAVSIVMVLIYLFRRYGLNSIKQAMHKKEQELIDLRLETNKLGLEVKKIELQIKKESADFVVLQERIMEWRRMVDVVEKERIERYELQQRRMKELEAIKLAHLHQISLTKQVVPQAVEKARSQLQQLCADGDLRQRYTETIMHFMQSSES